MTKASHHKKEIVPVPMEMVLQDQDRMTIHMTVHHERHGLNPTSLSVAYSRLLETQSQTYIRERVQVTEEWKLLETGWVEQPGVLFIENWAGRGLKVHPTEEERAMIAQQVLLVGHDPSAPPSWEVDPGMPFMSKIALVDGKPRPVYVRSALGAFYINFAWLPR